MIYGITAVCPIDFGREIELNYGWAIDKVIMILYLLDEKLGEDFL
jgi:hypothetical protein